MPHTVFTSLDFRKLFDVLPGLFVLMKPDYTLVAVSDAYLTISKKERKDLLGKNFFDVFPSHLDDPTARWIKDLKNSFEKVLRTKQPDTMTAGLSSLSPSQKEGSLLETKHWNSSHIPLLDPSGEVTYILRRVEDVTKFVETTDELKAIEQERDLFYGYSFDILAIVGADGYFKRLNVAAERILGYSLQELYSLPLLDFMHPDDVEKTKHGIHKLSDGSTRINSKNRYLCKNGTYRWISWNTVPMGAVFYSVGRDITEQVEAEERIKQLNFELEKKNIDLEKKIVDRVSELSRSEAQILQLQKMESIGRLAGGIAHDFNNMLGALSLFCDLLLDNPDDPEFVRSQVADIKDVAARATSLTRHLLTFSRKQIVQTQTVSLTPLIRQLEKMLARLIGENIKIKMNLAEDLRSVSVDPIQIEQVIMNLVVNAKDALPKGGTITIEATNVYLDEKFSSTHLSVNEGHYVFLSVSDDGIGMDATTAAQIFEPFFTTKPAGKGTGLGLSTTYGIIKQANGTIWVYSEPGKGTVFKIYLPIAEKIVEEVKATNIKPSLSQVANQTILVVEDDQHLRDGFFSILKKRGYQVLLASEGKEALDICGKHQGPIHLLLTDVIMPGISGFELAKKVLPERKETRVLYMSGYTSDALENAGIEDTSHLNFIQKPFGTTALMAKIQEVLGETKAPN